jgi:hypothetical protein
MSAQAQAQERTIAAADSRLQAWLLERLRQHGPGRYLLQVSADGKVTLKYLTPAVQTMCPERLRLNGNGRA